MYCSSLTSKYHCLDFFLDRHQGKVSLVHCGMSLKFSDAKMYIILQSSRFLRVHVKRGDKEFEAFSMNVGVKLLHIPCNGLQIFLTSIFVTLL
jgi:hypothetical protein